MDASKHFFAQAPFRSLLSHYLFVLFICCSFFTQSIWIMKVSGTFVELYIFPQIMLDTIGQKTCFTKTYYDSIQLKKKGEITSIVIL